MIVYPRYILPTENWARVANGCTITATSEKVPDYEAVRAGNDDPAWPWWADATSATLTCTFAETSDVDAVAIIHSNADVGANITVDGVSGGPYAITGAKGAGGYPKNLVAYTPGGSGSSVTIAIAGNTYDFSIGEVVAGPLHTGAFTFEPNTERERTRNVIDDQNPDFNHTIRYDRGGENFTLRTSSSMSDAAYEELKELWEITRGGVLPLLVIPYGGAEPVLVRMEPAFKVAKNKLWRSSYVFVELARGKMTQ